MNSGFVFLKLAIGLIGFWICPYAIAHGFGERYDLPVPLWLWVVGAGATIVLTFAVIVLFPQSRALHPEGPRINLFRVWGLRGLAHPITISVIRVLSVTFLLASVLSGFLGVPDPYQNLVPVAVWVVWWVGVAYVCALVGDLWAVLNPFRTLFIWAEKIVNLFTGGKCLSLEKPYPQGLSAWPAVAGLMVFFWAELIWPGGGVPWDLALAITIYAAMTWAGMVVFGRDVWLQNADTFSLVFGVFARFAPLALRSSDRERVRTCVSPACRYRREYCVNGQICLARAGPGDLEWILRPPALGLLDEPRVPASLMVLVITLLATVTFDGILETPLWAHVLERTLSGEVRYVGSVALVMFSMGFLMVFLGFSWLMAYCAQRFGDPQSLGAVPRPDLFHVASTFVMTLVPIAIAYHLAHYLSYLVISGQYLIPRLSDPLGNGWNLLGTRDYQVDISLLGARTAWYLAVAFIVAGHVFAVYIAHLAALRLFGNPRADFFSQLPMMVLMVIYTMVSLWILAQPMVS